MHNFNINEDQIVTLKKYWHNVDEYLSKDVDSFLDRLYSIILDTFDYDDEATTETYILEKIYDDIVYNNPLEK